MRYLHFLSDRATGQLPTGAAFIRNYVMNHPEYQQDSKLSDALSFDLLKMMTTMNQEGSEARQLLLGEYAWDFTLNATFVRHVKHNKNKKITSLGIS